MATTIQGGDTTICYGSLRLSTDENNSVDGTQGDWTFVEGSDNLYVVNNKNNKKYKITLEEVT
tara:strand:+ start:175 stop:363 length:189 start_codon:yes stop_codon:yes gene_type:complete